MNIAAYLEEQSTAVNLALDHYTRADGAMLSPALVGTPPLLLEAMRYSLMGGGKRLRPVLLIASAAIFGLRAEQVMPTACALEMIHTYSLVHDDLPCMDDDDLRRGRPTNHKVYGDAIAVLAGDALLTLAFEMLSCQGQLRGVTSEQVVRLVREISVAAGASGMVGGQVEDLAFEGREADLSQMERIHQAKTGALFRSCLRCGAILGGADQEASGRLDRYAEHFGLAFQIQDDLLDVIGDVVKTGKATGRDERHQKSTYVSRFGLQGARERAQSHVAAAMAAIAPLGARAEMLSELAKFVIDREG